MPEFREKEAQKLRAQNIRWTVSEDYEGDEGRAYARFFEENRPQSQDPETRLYYENALLGALARRFEKEKILAYASYLWEEMPGGELFTRVMAGRWLQADRPWRPFEGPLCKTRSGCIASLPRIPG